MNNKLEALIDHTLLKPTAQKSDLIKLCEEAKKYNFASVCVHSTHIDLCQSILAGTNVKICTVVGFPLGANLTQVKTTEARFALERGAKEIDMVINIGALKDRNEALVFHDIKSVADIVQTHAAILKVIIETSLLTEEEKILACKIAKKARAQFVKTSTGFSGGGATVEDVMLMKKYAYPLEVKASGGIKTRAQALAMIDAGATRLGTSSGVEIVENKESDKAY